MLLSVVCILADVNAQQPAEQGDTGAGQALPRTRISVHPEVRLTNLVGRVDPMNCGLAGEPRLSS